MKRSLSLLLSLALTATFATAAIGETAADGEYRDEFSSVKYNGSNGSLDWSPFSWKELNDDGSPWSGAVHVDPVGNCVSSNCLHIYSEGGELLGVGAQRKVDTSVFSDFELCYELRFDAEEPGTAAVLLVEKSINGGTVWHPVRSHTLVPGLQSHPQIPIGGPYRPGQAGLAQPAVPEKR